MKAGKQTTLCDEASVSGIGVHSGSPVTLTLHPADAGTGIVFLRTGLPGRSDCEIRADVRAVTATEFATVLGDDDGPLCATAEHVLAALAGLGVDNAVVEVDGPEVPIMDGSAEAFVAAIDHAGIRSLDAPRRYLKVLKPVRVRQGRSVGEILPNSRGLRLEIDIEFDHPLIGRQRCALDVSPTNFRRELARARTFGFMRDVAKLWSTGYALGALRIGQRRLVLDPSAPGRAAAAAIAAGLGAELLADRPPALDMADKGASRRLEDWLRVRTTPGDSGSGLG